MRVQCSTPRPTRELLTGSELVRDERDLFHIHLRQWKGAGVLGPAQGSSPLSSNLLGLARALSLPTKAAPFGSVSALFDDICTTFQTYLELPERAPEALAAFVISSWFPDCTPTVPLLVIHGAAMDTVPVLRILRVLCRRGLTIADATLAGCGKN